MLYSLELFLYFPLDLDKLKSITFTVLVLETHRFTFGPFIFIKVYPLRLGKLGNVQVLKFLVARHLQLENFWVTAWVILTLTLLIGHSQMVLRGLIRMPLVCFLFVEHADNVVVLVHDFLLFLQPFFRNLPLSSLLIDFSFELFQILSDYLVNQRFGKHLSGAAVRAALVLELRSVVHLVIQYGGTALFHNLSASLGTHIR